MRGLAPILGNLYAFNIVDLQIEVFACEFVRALGTNIAFV